MDLTHDLFFNSLTAACLQNLSHYTWLDKRLDNLCGLSISFYESPVSYKEIQDKLNIAT